MISDLDRLVKQADRSETQDVPELPFPLRFSFRLLGIILDCQWSFREHVTGLRAKAIKRLGIFNRVGNTTWGLESRILAITAHSLVESVVGYGLAVYGVHTGQLDAHQIDTGILTRVARRAVGTGITARREILHALADTKSFQNHYLQKIANVMDRTLRSTGTSARSTAIRFLHRHYHLNSDKTKELQNTYWCSLGTTGGKSTWSKDRSTKLTWALETQALGDENYKIGWVTKQTINKKVGLQYPTDGSIYIAMDEEILTNKRLSHLCFQKKEGSLGYEVALEVLWAVGWSPTVLFDAPQYLLTDSGGREINWAKIQ